VSNYTSTVPQGMAEGVYTKVKAYALEDPKEIERAAKYTYGSKFKSPRKPEEVFGE
jgi:hypothetical protein